jgi:hypothetical protein
VSTRISRLPSGIYTEREGGREKMREEDENRVEGLVKEEESRKQER